MYAFSLVAAEEILTMSASLKPVEHCTGPFLEGCDADHSGDISLEEWGHCLGLDQGQCLQGQVSVAQNEQGLYTMNFLYMEMHI